MPLGRQQKGAGYLVRARGAAAAHTASSGVCLFISKNETIHTKLSKKETSIF